jgi:aconitate hydratase
MTSVNSFKSKSKLTVGGQDLHLLFHARRRKERAEGCLGCPNSMKVVLENLLRFEDGRTVTKADIEAVAAWLVTRILRARNLLPPGPRADAGLHRRAGRGRSRRHARCDRQARRDPQKINPLVPVDLVIDHSVMVDISSARRSALQAKC